MSTKEGEANFPRRKEDALEPLSPKLWPNAREQTEKGEEKRGRWRGALVGRWDDPMWGRVQMMGKAEEGWGDGKREREGKRRWKGGHIFPWWGNRGSGWIERWLKRNLDGGAKSHRLPTSRGSKEKTRGGANRTVEREGEGSALSSQSGQTVQNLTNEYRDKRGYSDAGAWGEKWIEEIWYGAEG